MSVIGAVGDLVEDLVVELGGPVNLASDTEAIVSRRRGGSAANVAVAAAQIEGRARFIGVVGDDALGHALERRLGEAGVEIAGRRTGRSGTIVVLVDRDGERTMLSDRGSSAELIDPEREWVQGLDALHVPFYSLAVEPLSTTCRALIAWARAARSVVSLDVSSTAVVEAFGVGAFIDLLGELGPDIVFANEAEAALVGIDETMTALTSGCLVVHGPEVASVISESGRVDVRADDLGPVDDTTGAGDAFAAGFLVAWSGGAGAADAARRGHDAARDHLSQSD